MSLIPPLPADARRKIRYGIAVLCLFALVAPTILILTPARAKAVSVQSAPVAAPPDVYKVPSSTPGISGLGLQASIWLAEGLTVLPDAGERVEGFIGTVLGFIAPKLASKNDKSMPPAPAAPLTQPAATVDFDFDGDNKSDISRWHPGTKEFRIHNSGDGSYFAPILSTASGTLAPADYS